MAPAETTHCVSRFFPSRIALAIGFALAVAVLTGMETTAQGDDAKWIQTKQYQSDSAAAGDGQESRFRIAESFRIEKIFDAKQTGSLIAMTFDESGQILASRENGPLLRMIDSDLDGKLDKTTVFCQDIKNSQGILSLGGRLFVVGQGPEGAGLYRLHDADQDGVIKVVSAAADKPAAVDTNGSETTRIDPTDEIKLLLKFKSKVLEHGAHGLTLGPDGLIYVSLGNLASVEKEAEKTSPYHGAVDGDLIQPRHEDPGGHARGVKGPGGTIIRTDTDGAMVETFAGGFRNPYDLAFNRQGDLITHDADMESDEGLPWHRPTRLLHVTAGGEFGWRSGWAKWPSYYLDSLPATLPTGGGSPTGMVVYNHLMYPTSLHNALFVSDWANGRILVFRFKPSGASYTAQAEVFLEGHPLNATDLAVGPDGWLYLCTGGRGSEGGIYRIEWNGKVPESVTNLGTGMTAAIRQPQFNSAWARGRIAQVRQQQGDRWGSKLNEIAKDVSANTQSRVRALNLMQLFGPAPSEPLLIALSQDLSAAIRAKVAYLLGIHGTADSVAALARLAKDPNLGVARRAIEAFARSGQTPEMKILLGALASEDRHLSLAARRTLEQIPTERWKETILGSSDQRVCMQGAVALLTVEPTPQTAKLVLGYSRLAMKKYLNDRDFIDLLRVMQLALLHTKDTSEDLVALGTQLAEEYPSRSEPINREIVRLLVHLQDTSSGDRMISYLASSDHKTPEKIHLVMHLVRLDTKWTTAQKNEILKFLEFARGIKGGTNLGRYLEKSSMEFGSRLTDKQRLMVLRAGAQWPCAALASLVRLPSNLDDQTITLLQQLDGQLADVDSEAAERLKIGIVAVMGRSRDPKAMAHLRKIFKTQPERRSSIAMGLAQDPHGENWPVLLEALPILDAAAAQEVLARLAQSDRKAKRSEDFRQVILRGLQLKQHGGHRAIALLEKWTGQTPAEADEPVEAALARWQQWFAERYPNAPKAELPVDSKANQWSYKELLQYLSKGEGTKGSAARGRFVFTNARCIKCHQYGNHGETIGPNLSAVSRRFQKKEILQSILFPSHVISDQYTSKTVLTTDGQTHSGLLTQGPGGGWIVLTTAGEKVSIPADELDETAPSSFSAMPEGLLNDLTLKQIADLFAYLNRPPVESVSRQNTALDAKK